MTNRAHKLIDAVVNNDVSPREAVLESDVFRFGEREIFDVAELIASAARDMGLHADTEATATSNSWYVVVDDYDIDDVVGSQRIRVSNHEGRRGSGVDFHVRVDQGETAFDAVRWLADKYDKRIPSSFRAQQGRFVAAQKRKREIGIQLARELIAVYNTRATNNRWKRERRDIESKLNTVGLSAKAALGLIGREDLYYKIF